MMRSGRLWSAAGVLCCVLSARADPIGAQEADAELELVALALSGVNEFPILESPINTSYDVTTFVELGTGSSPSPTGHLHMSSVDGLTFSFDALLAASLELQITDIDAEPGRDIPGLEDGGTLVVQQEVNFARHTEVTHLGPAMQVTGNEMFDLWAESMSSPFAPAFTVSEAVNLLLFGDPAPTWMKMHAGGFSLETGDASLVQAPDGQHFLAFEVLAFLHGSIERGPEDPPFDFALDDSGGFGFLKLTPTAATVVPEPGSPLVLLLAVLPRLRRHSVESPA